MLAVRKADKTSLPNLWLPGQDEKALKFLSTIPQKWRLFWAIESIGISFALAIVALFSMGDSSPLMERNNSILRTWPTCVVWILNPTAVTVSSFLLSSTLRVVCQFCSGACAGADEPSGRAVIRKVFVNSLAAMKRAKECVQGETCFYITLATWLGQAVVNRWVFTRDVALRGSISFELDLARMYGSVLQSNKWVLLYTNVILAIGLVVKASNVFESRHALGTHIPETLSSSSEDEPRRRWSSWIDPRVSSLLVGWGIGYWVTSLLSLCLQRGGGCGWSKAASAVGVFAYIVIPCFLVASILMVADTNFLGTRFGALVKPAVDRLRNRRRVEYWFMASVLRDTLVLWVVYCELLDLNWYL